jgi:RNA polymerase sigma-70 factor, ECF subfamily
MNFSIARENVRHLEPRLGGGLGFLDGREPSVRDFPQIVPAALWAVSSGPTATGPCGTCRHRRGLAGKGPDARRASSAYDPPVREPRPLSGGRIMSGAERHPPDDDRDLVARAQAGDTRAFEELVRRHQRWVFTLALRMVGSSAEAEELAQEIFLKAYRGLGGFRGAARFSTWLHSIASHHCLNALETRSRQPLDLRAQERAGDDDPPPRLERVPNGAPGADAVLEQRERARLVQAALVRLRGDHRLVVVLRDIQGLSYEAIAETLGIELGTVRSRLHRARMELKALLAPDL